MRRLLAILAAALVAAPAAAQGQPPDLVVELPAAPYGGPSGQVAPVYMDAHEIPGRVLYRFDAVLRNIGGTLDVWRDTASGRAVQGIWAGGRPDVPPAPSAPPPPGASVTRVDLGDRGAAFEYVVEPTHEHWHFFSAAQYQLVAGGDTRDGAKVGFCFFDGFDLEAQHGERFFAPEVVGPARQTWCAFDDPASGFVRMGLSPGAADRYTSQREFQWIDVTGLAPGPAVLRATANAYGHLDEGTAVANNLLEVPRTLPGVAAPGAAVRTSPGAAVSGEVTARALALEVPARRAADCRPSDTEVSCYHWAAADDPLEFTVASAPAHGTVEAVRTGPDTMRFTYTPRAGFSGRDAFTYTATDARGLASPPAAMQVTVEAAAPEPTPPPVATPAATPPGPIVLSARVRGRVLVLRLSTRARVLIRLGRTVRRRDLAPGTHRIRLRGSRRRGRYRISLTARSGERREFRVLNSHLANRS